MRGDYPPKGSGLTYPVKLNSQGEGEKVIQAASNASIDRTLLEFRLKWGITDIITSADMRGLFSRHRFSERDLDDAGAITNLLSQAAGMYKTMATDESVRALSKIKYRNGLRDAIYEMADELVEN